MMDKGFLFFILLLAIATLFEQFNIKSKTRVVLFVIK